MKKTKTIGMVDFKAQSEPKLPYYKKEMIKNDSNMLLEIK
jgi:hypothetical protein